jgi:hypothetical protein
MLPGFFGVTVPQMVLRIVAQLFTADVYQHVTATVGARPRV